MKKIVLALILLTTLINCGNESNHIVTGKIQTLGLDANQKVFIYKMNEKAFSAIDSSIVGSNGEFRIELGDSNRGIFYFGSSKTNTLPIVLNNDSEKIELDIKNNQQLLIDYGIKGSKQSEQMALFYKKVYAMMKFNQELSQKSSLLAPDNKAGQAILEQESMMASQEFLKFRDQFIKDNKGTEALLVALEQIRPETEYELFKEVAEDLIKTLPNSPYSSNLSNYLSQLEQQQAKQKKMDALLSIGSQAPELDFPNPKGKNIKLSSLKGKVVLLDFWAAWCKPCRAENPNVVKTYNKYKEKGFEVYSFSLDEEKEKWIKAIKADGLVWKNHVSDLKGWNSQSVSIYGFRGIPFTVLIDRDGKILAKKLRGEQLEAALKKAL